MKLNCSKTIITIFMFGVFATIQGQNIYDVTNISDPLKKNSSSIVRSNKISITIPKQDKLIYSQRKIITVLSKEGNNHVDAFVEYDKSRKVKKLQAVIYDSKGKELEKFKKNDFKDVSAIEGGTLYSDNRVMYLQYYPESYPYTVEIDYTIESDNTAFIPTFYLHTNYNSSIEHKSIEITYEPSLGLRQKVFDPDKQMNINKSQGLFKVSVSNLESLIAEPYSPNIYELVPNINFATDKFQLEGIDGTAISWEEFGKWEYENLLEGLDRLSNETILKIDKLVKNAKTNKEKVKLIYQYVQENTRYISVQLGIGGLRPNPAKEVDELGYGDCKGLSNYTMALLKTQGIESFYAEVWGGSSKRNIEKDFASIQGNHVILNVPLEDEDIWLECTSQTLPFNFLGDFTDDRDVLLLTQKGGVFKRTPKYSGNDNKIVTKANFLIDAEGTIDAKIEMKSTGIQYDRRYSVAHLDSKEQDSFYKHYWDYIDNINLSSVNVLNNQDDILFKENIELKAKSYARKAEDKLFIPLNAFQRMTNKPVINYNRKHPLVFDREFRYEDEYSVIIPADYTIENIPSPINIDSPFGIYKTSVEKINDKEVIFKRLLQLNEGYFNADMYNEFRDFMRSINKGDSQKMIIINTPN